MTDIFGALSTSQAQTSSANVKTRTNLALHHLFAACRFSAKVKEIENANLGKEFSGFWEEILHNSLGVATLSVAALESYANEMYFEGAVLKPSMNASAAEEMARIIDRETIVKKYSLALSIIKDKKLNSDIPVSQNVEALIKVRNSIIHFKPEWFGEKDKHEKLSLLLKNRFQPSPFLANEPLFPRAWASHSFTVWALKTTINFIEHFHSEADTESPLTQFKERLNEYSDGEI
jgi:hypothetical protein